MPGNLLCVNKDLWAPANAEATCKKVLLNAFTRALRDGFPPARVAGLKAIVATAQYHSPEDAAMRVLPAVGPLCIDPVHEVRASALACLEHFTKALTGHHRELERKAAVQEGETSGGKLITASAPGSKEGGSLLNSFGWAVSNLGLGRSSADAAGAKPAVATAGIVLEPALAAASASKQVDAPPPTVASHITGTPAAPPATSSGWDDDDLAQDMMRDAEAGESVSSRRLLAEYFPLIPGFVAFCCPQSARRGNGFPSWARAGQQLVRGYHRQQHQQQAGVARGGGMMRAGRI